jgi:Rad3-related DNA helicase
MVGLPYPNVKSPELEEKMRYLDKTVVCDENIRALFITTLKC